MKLYIGNLPYTFTEENLKKIFEKYSSVTSCKLVIDRDTGRSKGFGFIELDSDEEAQEAISEINGKDFDGRAVVVNEARPKEDRNNKRGGGNGGNGGGFRRGNRY